MSTVSSPLPPTVMLSPSPPPLPSATAAPSKVSATAAPSKVLYFDWLPAHWTERDLAHIVAPAAVVKSVFLRKRNAIFASVDAATHAVVPYTAIQALVEVADIATATSIVQALAAHPLVVAATSELACVSNSDDNGIATATTGTITASYSKTQELHERAPSYARSHALHHRNHRRPSVERAETPNRILLVTVQNPTVPVTTDLVHRVFSAYGVVEKVVVFVKPMGLQTLVQFASVDEATHAKSALTGLSIFPDSCGLQLSFSNRPELAVQENGLRTKDFTNPSLPQADDNDSAANANVATTSLTITGDASELRTAGGRRMSAPVAPLPASIRDASNSPVLLVCSLRESVTCDQLFNLFSCYGNVIRVKKLSNKTDHALVQFQNPVAAQSALTHLRGFTLLGKTMEISFSKFTYISVRPGATDTPHVKEYGHTMNRFTSKVPASASKHVYSPTKVLHLSNLDDSVTQEDVKCHMASFHGGEHCKATMLINPSGHVQAFVEFANVAIATNVLIQAHNSTLGSKRAISNGLVFNGSFIAVSILWLFGTGVQFPWEHRPANTHATRLAIQDFGIDKHPVTNAQYARFLAASAYRPTSLERFLAHWDNRTDATNSTLTAPIHWRVPPALATSPVVFVAREDADAFARFYHKRLPHDWEWQYVASNGDRYDVYPWGSEIPIADADVPRVVRGKELPPLEAVGSHPQSQSTAFGVHDLVGYVWQMTDAFCDAHTCGQLLRGGSLYQPVASTLSDPNWYFPPALTATTHNRWLMTSASYDRSPLIGFRCAKSD